MDVIYEVTILMGLCMFINNGHLGALQCQPNVGVFFIFFVSCAHYHNCFNFALRLKSNVMMGGGNSFVFLFRW